MNNTFVDLGLSPLCESYVMPDQLDQPETFYPLHVRVCAECYLVQLPEHVAPDKIYSEYAYFSSYSASWIAHMQSYCERICDDLALNADSMVMELASNDGYLLQHFKQRNIPCLGIEPAANVAKVAQEKGIPTLVEFFSDEVARRIVRDHGQPDLLIGNNVLAHVPDINDFVAGMKSLLKSNGLITMEFPHLLRLIKQNQFDTIYHEHYSYLSLYATEQVFERHGLQIFDIEQLPTHGGSLRIYASHRGNRAPTQSDRLAELRNQERAFGINNLEAYKGFGQRAIETKHRLLEFLIDARRRGKSVVGYGAPGKGNTLLNYCGISTDLIQYTVDRNPYKQGLYTPGSRIPIFEPDHIKDTRPDYLIILPWNLADEITSQMAMVREWGGQFVVPIPEVRVL